MTLHLNELRPKFNRMFLWLALAIALPLAHASAQTFLTVPLNLSGTGHAAVPSIAIGPGGDIDVVWLDSGAILFRRSLDGGQTFSATMTVATTMLPPQPSQPQIAVNSAGVYVSWAGPGDVFFSSLMGSSGAWTAPLNVSLGKGIMPGGAAPVPHMAVDPSGAVDIVWGQNGAFFARFANGAFSAAVQLTASAMARQSPRIAINAAGHIFVVWENAASCPTITFARSTTGGAGFTSYSVADNLTVNGQPVTGCTSDVQIAVGANNTVHLLWANENTQIQDLIATYATDSDQAFSTPNFPETDFQNISNTASRTPQMMIDGGGNIDVTWIGDYQTNGAPPAVYFTRSTNGGVSFATPLPLTAPPTSVAGAGFPQITAEPSGAIDVLWQQASATNPGSAFDIVLARSTDGVHFTNATLDSTPTTQSGTAQIAADPNNNVYATWQASSGGADVFINGDSAGLKIAAQFSISGVKLSVSPVSAVINTGGSATFSLSLTSTNSVPGSVTLACGGAPAGVNCSFNPNPINLAANGSASATLSVGVTMKPSASVVKAIPADGFGDRPGAISRMALYAWVLGLTLLIAIAIGGQRARNLPQFARALAFAVLLAVMATGMVSCGGSTHSGGNGGAGGSITFPLTLHAQSNSATASLQTISITVP